MRTLVLLGVVALQVVTLAVAGLLFARVQELEGEVQAIAAGTTSQTARLDAFEADLTRRLEGVAVRLEERIDQIEPVAGGSGSPASGDTGQILRRLDRIEEAIESFEERVNELCAGSVLC